MIMVKAGPAVDAVIESLKPLLDPGDIIIDGGNTYYADTERRTKEVEEAGFFLRHRRVGRRGGRAQGPQHDAGRVSLTAGRTSSRSSKRSARRSARTTTSRAASGSAPAAPGTT